MKEFLTVLPQTCKKHLKNNNTNGSMVRESLLYVQDYCKLVLSFIMFALILKKHCKTGILLPCYQ